MYLSCGRLQQDQPTCSDPNKKSSGVCQAGCNCPQGTVLDEIQKKCAPISECSKIICIAVS